MDKFEYVMHGLLYKLSDDESGANPEKYVYIYRLYIFKHVICSHLKQIPYVSYSGLVCYT